MTVADDVELQPARDVYRSAAILALIPDDVARYWARVTGRAEIHGAVVKLYDHGWCDWLGCYYPPARDLPAGPARFCAEHRIAHGHRVRAQLIHAARESQARRHDLLAALRGAVERSGA